MFSSKDNGSTLVFQSCLPYLIEREMAAINAVLGVVFGVILLWVQYVILCMIVTICLSTYLNYLIYLSLIPALCSNGHPKQVFIFLPYVNHLTLKPFLTVIQFLTKSCFKSPLLKP